MAVSDQMTRAVFRSIQEQMGRQTFYDVIITVKGRTFECHRFLLSACSRFFRAMFSSGMSEDLNKMVDIKGIDPETFSLVIDCIYKASNLLNVDNIMSIWHTATYLQIDFLIESCEMFQTKQLSKDNCVDIFVNAKLLDSLMLKKMSWDIIVKEFEHLRKTEYIFMLEYDDILKLVAEETLEVSSEDIVIDFTLRWVNFVPNCIDAKEKEQPSITSYETSAKKKEAKKKQKHALSKEDGEAKDEADLKLEQSNIVSACKRNVDSDDNQNRKQMTNREKCLPNLLKAAKICLVSSTYIQALLENKMVTGNASTFATVLEGLRYQLQPGRRHDYCPSTAIFRKASKFTNVIIGIRLENTLTFSCSTMDGIWFRLAPPPFNCPYKAVTFENDIYVSCEGYLFSYKYDSSTNVWRQLANSIIGRYQYAMICHGSYIYIVGGDNVTAIERFNAKDEQSIAGSGRWETIGNLKQAVSDIVVTTFGCHLIIFGSISGNTSSTVMQCFDTHIMSAHNFPNDMSGSSRNMVTLKLEDSTYLLQETGDLWKLVACDKSSINLEFQGKVWDVSVQLSGAVIYNQELLVFVKSIDPQMSHSWETTNLPFKNVKIIERYGNCFMNCIILKGFLTVKA